MKLLVNVTIILFATAALGEDVEFSGVLWSRYSHDFSSDDGRTNGFAVDRAWLTATTDVGEDFVASATIDLAQRAESENAFFYYAFLKWERVYIGADAAFGLIPTASVDKQTVYWGYRPIQKTPLHRVGHVQPSDYGVDLHGAYSAFDYWAQITNSAGFISAEDDPYKRFAVRLGAEPTPGLWVHGYGDVVRSSLDDTTTMDATLLDFMLGYKQDKYAVSGEVFTRMYSVENVDQGVSDLGFAVYGWYKFTPAIGALARVDVFDPNTDVDDDGHTLLIGGLDLSPHERVHFIPNVQVVSYQAEGAESDNTAGVTGTIRF